MHANEWKPAQKENSKQHIFGDPTDKTDKDYINACVRACERMWLCERAMCALCDDRVDIDANHYSCVNSRQFDTVWKRENFVFSIIRLFGSLFYIACGSAGRRMRRVCVDHSVQSTWKRIHASTIKSNDIFLGDGKCGRRRSAQVGQWVAWISMRRWDMHVKSARDTIVDSILWVCSCAYFIRQSKWMPPISKINHFFCHAFCFLQLVRIWFWSYLCESRRVYVFLSNGSWCSIRTSGEKKIE